MPSSPHHYPVGMLEEDREKDKEKEPPEEYTVQVHIWLSATTSASYKGPKKKSDRRDKSTPSFEDGRKLREKSSWATTLPRGSTAGGQWRSATCRLREEPDDRCHLSIILDDVVLFKTIRVHMLRHTDVRPADVSLFSKKNCLAIDTFAPEIPDRFYLLFPDQETCSLWLCLIRSYSVFELYGRWANPEDGGLYRLWRQLELTVASARNLGQVSPATAVNTTTTSLSAYGGRAEHIDSDQETMSPDIDIFSEIWLNGLLCARTSSKKDSLGGREWQETFVFPDLPPFDKLEVVVWQQQEASKSGKSEVLGKVRIPLATFRRGEMVDGRYPVLKSGPVAGDLRVGEMRLKIKVEEEIVMPLSVYKPLLDLITQRNFMEWSVDLEKNWGVKSATSSLTSVALYNNTLIDNVIEFSTNEIAGALLTSKQTIFRGNSALSKSVESCMCQYGQGFLEASIGPVIRRMCSEGVAIEVDPIRITSKNSARGMEKNMESLVYWCTEFWKQIYSSRDECPNELRRVFEHIRTTIAKNPGTSSDPKLRWQGVSAFCFLRFIVPAIINPQLFGLWNGMPPPPVVRSLKLVGKVIQSLSNLNESKEDFMKGMANFLRDHYGAMQDYLWTISTPLSPRAHFNPQSNVPGRGNQLQMTRNGLHMRQLSMPHLGRESIPKLPHLLDLPRSLAVITSAVLHHCDSSKAARETPPPDTLLADLIKRCFHVEEAAKERVKELARATTAAKPTSPLARPPLTNTSNVPSPTAFSSSPPSATRKRYRKRPSTAPVSANSDTETRHRPPDFFPVTKVTSADPMKTLQDSMRATFQHDEAHPKQPKKSAPRGWLIPRSIFK